MKSLRASTPTWRGLVAAAVLSAWTADASAQEWRVAHWNLLHGWGRYWDTQFNPPPQDPALLYPPNGAFTAISDDGSGPDGLTYGIDTAEPTNAEGCNSTYPAAWNHPNQPIQNMLRSAQVGGDPQLVAMTLSEAKYCLSATLVKNAIVAGHSGWGQVKVASYTAGNARGDSIIARYGWVDEIAPVTNTGVWNASTNPGSDVAIISSPCTTQTKYHVLHGHIYTDSARTREKAVHLFATRIQGDSACETTKIHEFILAKAGASGRILLIGDFNFRIGEAGYNDLIAKDYTEAGSSAGLPPGDKSALTCCFGSKDGNANGATFGERIDMAFHKNIGEAMSYWVGNKSVPAGVEVAMSDHAIVRVGFAADDPPPSGDGWTIVDTFDDNSLDETTWVRNNLFSGSTDTSISVNETNQRLEIPLPLNNAGYNGIRTQPKDFAGGYARVRLVQPPAQASTAYAMFTIGDADTHYRFWKQGTSLVCEEKVNNVKSTPNPCAVTYNATSHQFLQIRHDAQTGEAVWETAPAIGEVPGTWVELARRLWNVTSLPIASVMLELKAGSSSNETVAPGTVVFDTFAASNEDESAEVILVEDDFNDNSLAADWIEGNVFSGATDTGIPVDEANQRLEIGPLPLNNSGYNGVRTAVQAFAGGYAYVRLVSAPASNTAAYAMYTVGDADTHYRFWIQANTLVCEEKINNVKSAPNPCATTYSPAAHQFLRISHDTTTNEAVWAVAPASGSGPGAFTELARRTWSTASLPLTGVMFELKGGSSSNETNPPGIVAFDTFKAARPQ